MNANGRTYSLPYLTLAEAAELGRLSSKRLQNLMGAGVLVERVHFCRPGGRRPLFIREAFIAWLEGRDGDLMAKARAHRLAG